MKTQSSFYRNFGKRVFDFLLSVVIIIFSSLPIILIVILIFILIGKPVFFIQPRPGKDGKIFKIYKFRTMTEKKDAYDNLLEDKERLIAFGTLLRRFSLDELPQIFNVLIGDISFVGPRPLLVEYLPLYNNYQRRRHHVKPGMTGWAQINGRNAISWGEKFELDIWYVDNMSFCLDCKILFYTFLKVFKGSGITSNTSVTMQKFIGN
jgi:undecaprenyl phosphate N,N'-diacetylbacillosamine 1-phosphate transferase